MRGRRIEANSLCRSYTHPHPAAMPPPSPWEGEGPGRMVSAPTQLCNASCGRPPHRYRTAFLCGARRPRRATAPRPKFVILRRSGRIRVPRLQTSLIRPFAPQVPPSPIGTSPAGGFPWGKLSSGARLMRGKVRLLPALPLIRHLLRKCHLPPGEGNISNPIGINQYQYYKLELIFHDAVPHPHLWGAPDGARGPDRHPGRLSGERP